MLLRFFFWLVLIAAPLLTQAQVVINEILFHAPDDLDDLQYLELYNTGSQAVDLSGWHFAKGIKFTFKEGTKVEAQGFVVICRNAARFREFYQASVAGEFSSRISHKGEHIELRDARGKVVDSVKFKDRAPWPTGTDGYSGSLERISPAAPSDEPANWISSPLSEDRTKPAGSPGKPNAGYAAKLPPVITAVSFRPEFPEPNQEITVEAEVRADMPVEQVNLLFRLAGPGFEKPEVSVSMRTTSSGHLAATIPGQAAGQLIRFRVEVIGPEGAQRFFPAETEPRPALSAYVPGRIEPALVPFGWIIYTTEKDMKVAEAGANEPMFGGFAPPPPDPEEPARDAARNQLEQGLDLSPIWLALTAEIAGEDIAVVQKLRTVFITKLAERKKLIENTLGGEGIQGKLASLPELMSRFMADVVEGAKPFLTDPQKQALTVWLDARSSRAISTEQMITSRADLEAVWQAITLNADLEAARWSALRTAIRQLVQERRVLLAEVAAGTGKDSAFSGQRERADSLRERIGPSLRPQLSAAQVRQLEAWEQLPREIVVGFRDPGPGPGGPPMVFFGGPGGPGPGPGPGGMRMVFRAGPGGPGAFGPGASQPVAETASHRSAFVYFDPATRKTELFDFVQITGRKGGQKVHFQKDHPLGEMTTIALIFEGDTASLVEPLAYEVYRRAGMPVEQSFHVRLWQSGKPAGYFLLIEQPNRAFLRRNQINDSGNIYKLLWFGGGLIEQHEKHTNRRQGHEDLVAVVDGLEKTKSDGQWEFIRTHFDVDQVATYFAVNMVLSHWDGFFNNYFAYHDSRGTDKWMMFPWDQDSTWGLRDMPDGEVFYNMALTFGMNGDTPSPDGGQWRPPGWFSGPLLANPEFRKVFLARTRQILEEIYTPEVFDPVIAAMEEKLIPEVKLRAQIQGQNPTSAVENLKSDLARCRKHLRLRRQFLLAQEELKRVGAETKPGSRPEATVK